MQGCNRIFDRFRHCIYFGLLGNILTTDNGIHCGVYSGEILVVILVQVICLGNSLIDLVIVRILILQGYNRIFNRFRHCIYFTLLRKLLATGHSIDSGFHTSEVLVVILVQGIRLGNSLINFGVISKPDKLQGKGFAVTFSTVVFVGNGVFATFHCQRVSTYFPTAPVACPGNVEVSRQGRKVKCAVIVNNDLVDVVAAIKDVHVCVADI